MHTEAYQNGFFKKNAAAILAFILAGAYGIIYRDLFTGARTFSHDSLVWFGSFHYYLENIKNGIFPYWDPYSLTGTLFYPNISGYGLLDPTVLLCALASKIAGISSLKLFIYFRLCRIFLFVAGAFFLFRSISGNGIVSVLSAGILLFTVTIQNKHQPMMDLCFSIPFALFLILRLFDAIETRMRYRYMFGLALVTGVSMNIYIPALYLFNIVSFVLLVFAVGRCDRGRILRAFWEPKMLWSAGACLLLTTMMASPPLAVSLLDTTKEGELFAIAKLVDSYDGNFKEMMASDFGGDIFFDKLRKHSAALISYGSVLNLLYPDSEGHRSSLLGEIPPGSQLYMGIIPIVLIMIGAVYVKARLKYAVLAMTGLVFFITFSFSGIHNTYNMPQKVMNTLFPPLRMLDMRINFMSVLSFYLCMLFCIILAAFMRKDRFFHLVQTRFRSLALCILALMAVIVMINITLHGTLALSGYDAIIMLTLFVMLAGISGMRYKILPEKRLFAALLFLLILDLAHAGIKSADTLASSHTVMEFLNTKERYRQFSIEESKRSHENFEYFRLPYVASAISPVQAFIETMVQTKSAIISNSLISIFTTKRYYDLFSLMPLEQQLAVTGVVYPVVRFYPLAQIVFNGDSRDIFNSIRRSDMRTLGSLLYVEQKTSLRGQTAQTTDLREMKDVAWFGTSQINDIYRQNIPYMKEVRMKLDRILNTGDYRVHVDRFSINDIAITVENRIDGYLLYNDGWSRYWKAYDYDRELPLVIANYNSKAVFLDPGKHQIRFVFSPTYYQAALVLYYAGLVLSCVIIALAWRHEKRRTTRL